MSFEEPSLRNLLEQKVTIRPVARMVLAGVVIAGGLAFFVLGALLLLHRPSTPYPHPLGAALLALVIVTLGACFVWIGLRLMRKSADSENLLSPLARRRSSLVVGVLAASMLAFAVETDSVLFFATAVFALMFSYWLFPIGRP